MKNLIEKGFNRFNQYVDDDGEIFLASPPDIFHFIRKKQKGGKRTLAFDEELVLYDLFFFHFLEMDVEDFKDYKKKFYY